MSKRAVFLLLAAIIILFSGSFPALAEYDWLPDELTPEEIREERYYSIIDEEGNVITVTGRRLYAGDEYLTSDNRLFEIYQVEKYTAYARYRETVELLDPLLPAAVMPNPVQAEPRGIIAIFHTHNAESYVPTDGTDSIYGRGGIHDVGDAFKQALEEKGIEAIHSEDMHLPHDRGAYLRARETVLELLEEQPDAIFDIHRDAAPPEQYIGEVDGDLVAQIQFVVGTQNPTMAVNRQLAFDLKGYADRMYDNLVRGVLFNNGNYNQDLYPTMLLLEVGSHLTEQELAEESITLFSDVVAYYFYGPETIQQHRETEGVRVAGWTIAKILTAVAAGVLFFFFLNNPGSFTRLAGKVRKSLSQGIEKLPRWLAELRKIAQYTSRQVRERVKQFREKLKTR